MFLPTYTRGLLDSKECKHEFKIFIVKVEKTEVI